jgi:beta-phosphoglucomutase
MMAAEKELGAIFDLDGVLVDTGWAHRQAWYDLARKEGYSMSDDFFQNTFGMQNDHILPILAGRQLTADEIKTKSDWKEQRYRDIMATDIKFVDGAESLLQNLRLSEFRIAIGTSAPKANLELIFGRLDAFKYFDVLVTQDDVDESKPSPKTFLKAAEKLGLPAQNCIVIEDAIPGVQAAKAANMPVIAVTSTRKRDELSLADKIVDSLAEVTLDDFKKLLSVPL